MKKEDNLSAGSQLSSFPYIRFITFIIRAIKGFVSMSIFTH